MFERGIQSGKVDNLEASFSTENVRYAALYDEILIAASDIGVSNLKK